MITENGKYLLFADSGDAAEANLKIYENLARLKTEVVRTATDEVVDPVTIPDGDIVSMVYTIPGYTQGTLQSEGYTTAYAEIHECDNGDGFVMPKPIDALMTGVTYDSIETDTTGWYADVEI